MYSKRIETLCSLLFPVDTFADIGCDHGYCTEYMLRSGLCRQATVTDISAECLQKAETLLREYIAKGVCTPLCTDGLRGVDKNTDLVLIAGMGGMEIAHILTDAGGFVPKNFVLQPMRDAAYLREVLLRRGARIERDFTFADGKFYDVIVGRAADDGGVGEGDRTEESQAEAALPYSRAELEFGRENLSRRGGDFLAYLRGEIEKKDNVLARPLSERARREVTERKEYLQGVLAGEIK